MARRLGLRTDTTRLFFSDPVYSIHSILYSFRASEILQPSLACAVIRPHAPTITPGAALVQPPPFTAYKAHTKRPPPSPVFPPMFPSARLLAATTNQAFPFLETNAANMIASPLDQDGDRGLALKLVLSIVVCGLWAWIARMAWGVDGRYERRRRVG